MEEHMREMVYVVEVKLQVLLIGETSKFISSQLGSLG